MRLILTNYIASLKEDKELDVLIQDILMEFEVEIIFGPQRGRQYGVDIYAVGEDPEDKVDHDYEKIKIATLSSSQLLTNLIEWTVVINDKTLYDAYVKLKNILFKDVTLVLWFPDKETERAMFIMNATAPTGYTLSNIIASDNFEEFKQITIIEDENNSIEKEFIAFQQGIWTVGLVASRHYRTYVFPHYWRQFIVKQVEFTTSEE
jgi:hypothetical protein